MYFARGKYGHVYLYWPTLSLCVESMRWNRPFLFPKSNLRMFYFINSKLYFLQIFSSLLLEVLSEGHYYCFMLALLPAWSELIWAKPCLSAHRFNIGKHTRLTNFYCTIYVKQKYTLKRILFTSVFTRRKRRFYQRRNYSLFYPRTNHTIIKKQRLCLYFMRIFCHLSVNIRVRVILSLKFCRSLKLVHDFSSFNGDLDITFLAMYNCLWGKNTLHGNLLTFRNICSCGILFWRFRLICHFAAQLQLWTHKKLVENEKWTKRHNKTSIVLTC